MAVDSKTFSRLKQSNAKRLKMLQHLLSLLELDTSVAPSHALTPCYILVQEQVSILASAVVSYQRAVTVTVTWTYTPGHLVALCSFRTVRNVVLFDSL